MQKEVKSDSNPLYQYQTMPESEYLFMEDMLEQNNFNKAFKEQASEVSKQTKKLEKGYPLISSEQKQAFTYAPYIHAQKQEIDLDNLNFMSILQIASGNVP